MREVDSGDYDFVIIAERVQRGFDHSHSSIITGCKEEGGLKLVIPTIKNGRSWKSKSVEWIMKKVHENVDKRKYTYLFSFVILFYLLLYSINFFFKIITI